LWFPRHPRRATTTDRLAIGIVTGLSSGKQSREFTIRAGMRRIPAKSCVFLGGQLQLIGAESVIRVYRQGVPEMLFESFVDEDRDAL